MQQIDIAAKNLDNLCETRASATDSSFFFFAFLSRLLSRAKHVLFVRFGFLVFWAVPKSMTVWISHFLKTEDDVKNKSMAIWVSHIFGTERVFVCVCVWEEPQK